MEYDRVQIKLAAKAKIRRGDPKPWLVTLVYLLLTSVPGSVLSFFLIMATSALSTFAYRCGAYYASELLMLFPFLFLNILGSLFAVVLGTGYQHWSMKLWRGQRTEVKDLFRCFPMAGKVIRLYLLILAFTLLWMLAAFFVGTLPVALLLWFFDGEFLTGVITFLAIAGWTAFLYNRILLYSMAFYLLLDHPEWTALKCLNESKTMMQGRRWSLFTLKFSFAGWYLLIAVIIYAIIFALVFFSILFLFVAFGYAELYAISTFLMFGGFLAALLCSAPLLLWLTPYVSLATAGFYDCAAGIVPASAPDVPNPQPPTSRYYYSGPPSGQDGTPPSSGYYSGFLKKPTDDIDYKKSDSEQ